MELAALIFFALLYAAHQICGLHEPLDQPMCAFREGDYRTVGYALFFAIALIGALYAVGLRKHAQQNEAFNPVGAGLLLLIVVLTPGGEWHDAAAFVLLAAIFAHYAILLIDNQTLFWVHLSVPVALAMLTGFQSYGLWQKSIICYLVTVATVHHHLVVRAARDATASDRPTKVDRHAILPAVDAAEVRGVESLS